jgi:hypothetical protein
VKWNRLVPVLSFFNPPGSTEEKQIQRLQMLLLETIRKEKPLQIKTFKTFAKFRPLQVIVSYNHNLANCRIDTNHIVCLL